MNPVAHSVEMADGHQVAIEGSMVVPIYISNKSWVGKAVIMSEMPYDIILGIDAMKGFKMNVDYDSARLAIKDGQGREDVSLSQIASMSICSFNTVLEKKCNLTPEEGLEFDEFLTWWKKHYETSPGKTDLVKHKIYIDPGIPPIKQKYYPVSPAMLKIIHTEIEELLVKGLIIESESPWSSPVLLVKKKNGKWRLCIDYRQVNRVSRKNAYPLPFINDILNQLKDAVYVSSIDLVRGYHQIAMDEDSRQYTAFTVPGKGLYEFTVMPFGLTSAPNTFQSLMEKILRPMLGKSVFVYLDDILIIGKTFEEHQRNLKLVLEKLYDAGLAINWEKSSFLKSHVEYLGFVVGQGEITVSPKKVEAIKDFPAPIDVKGIRSFLGMSGWYRRFIPKYSDLAQPLTQLLQKKTKFHWGPEQQKSFDTIKDLLCQHPIVHCPDFTLPFSIETDASNVGLGGVLVQHVNGEERVIAYTSRTLNQAEQNYTTTERECLAVLHSMSIFRPYIEGAHFTVVTDHASLKWLMGLHEPTGRLARWVTKFSQYDYDILHLKGKFMNVPDALSRAPYNLIDKNSEEVCIAELQVLPDEFDFSDTKDRYYVNLKQKILDNQDAYPAFLVENDKIFKCVSDPDTKQNKLVLVIPTEFRQKILQSCHSRVEAGHLGTDKTLDKIRRRYYCIGQV